MYQPYQHPFVNVQIASPCPARWEDMKGDDQVRFCKDCRLNVFNLSDMTTRQALDLIVKKQGRLCVRFYQRSDGTILTNDCPVGLRAIRRQVLRLRMAAALVISSIFIALGFKVGATKLCNETRGPIRMDPEMLKQMQSYQDSRRP